MTKTYINKYNSFLKKVIFNDMKDNKKTCMIQNRKILSFYTNVLMV